MLDIIAHVLSLIGFSIMCGGYYLTINDIVKPTDRRYLWANLIGALALLFSLLIHFNLGSILIEIFLCMVTTHALIKSKP